MRTVRVDLAVILSALVLACLTACTTDVVDHESEPLDLRDNLAEQGLIDCTERTDTGYTSGTSFAITVVTVDGKPAERDTANAYWLMQQAAAQDGVAIRIVSGFRTNSEQTYLYGCYTNCNCNSCNLAARPGFSNHQSGHALDLNTSESGVLTWLNNHGDEYGFERTVPSEAWHWEWWGGGPGGGPCTDVPAECTSGDYAGSFCDDEGQSAEASHDCVAEAGIMGQLKLMDGEPAFGGATEATRAKSAQVLLRLAGLTEPGDWPDAFTDDDGHALEPWLNAAKHHGLLFGSNGHANPDGIATRTTLAVMLSRLYGLPPATQDYFDDDDGTTGEPWHDQMKESGLMGGYGTEFRGGERATRNTLSIVACRGLNDEVLVPHWLQPPPAPTDAGTAAPADAGTADPPPTDAGSAAPPPDDVDPAVGDPPGHVQGPGAYEDAPPETEPPQRDEHFDAAALPPSVHEGCAAATTTTTGAPTSLVLGAALLLAARRRRVTA